MESATCTCSLVQVLHADYIAAYILSVANILQTYNIFRERQNRILFEIKVSIDYIFIKVYVRDIKFALAANG